MSIMFHDTVDGNQSFLTTNWTEVASKSGQLNATSNFILISAEYGCDTLNGQVGIRVLINGTERSFDYHICTLANQYKKFCDFGILTLETPGENTISLEVRALASGQYVLVRRIRLMVFQV